MSAAQARRYGLVLACELCKSVLEVRYRLSG
jgi:hypothetical protein